MSNKTRKRIWPVSAVAVIGMVAILAALAVTALMPGATQAQGVPPPVVGPDGLEANAVSQTEIELAWNPGLGQATYELQRREGSAGAYIVVSSTITGTSYNDTGLTAGTMYTYRVRGVNSGGVTAWSIATATTEDTDPGPIDPVPPGIPAPDDFKIDALDNGARLSWDALPDSDDYTVDSYQIDRVAYHADSNNPILINTGDATIDIGMVQQYRDLGLSYGTTYTYRVRAYVSVPDADGGNPTMAYGPWSDAETIITANSGGRLEPLLDPPTAVQMLMADPACANSITVSWQAPDDFGTVPTTDENGVYVGPDYIGGEGAGKEEVGEDAMSVSYKVERMVGSGSWTSVMHTDMMYMDNNVAYGQVYKYRVRAMNGAKLYGPWAMATVDLTEEPPAPNQPRSLNVDPVGNTVELQWDPPVDDATPLLWRTQADFDLAGDESAVLDYVIERKVGDGNWMQIRKQPHEYADRFVDVLTQGYTDAAPPIGSVSYRVAALVDDCNRSPYNQKDPVDIVNQAPVGEPIANQSTTVGDSVTVNTSFTDADQATLDYTVMSSDETVATAMVTDMGVVTVTGVAAGSATITVTATDSRNTSDSQSFMVTVRQAGLGMASDIRIGLNTGGVLQVTWDAADNATGYIVIAVSKVDNRAVAGAVNPGVGGALPTTLNLAGLTSGEGYFVYVAATGADGGHTLSIPPADVTAN